MAWKRRLPPRFTGTSSRITSSYQTSGWSSSISIRSRSAIRFVTWHLCSPILLARPGRLRCRRIGRVRWRRHSSTSTFVTHLVRGEHASGCTAPAPSSRWQAASSGLKSRLARDNRSDCRRGATSLRGGPGLTGPGEGRPEDPERRPPRRRFESDEEEDRPDAKQPYAELFDPVRAANELFAELLDELRLLDERKPLSEGSVADGTDGAPLLISEFGRDRRTDVPKSRRRRIAKSVAVILTGLSVS